MQTVPRAFAATLVMVVAAAAFGCVGSSEPPQPAAQRPAAITWREIGAWSGRGNRQTESFEVSPSALRLRWRTTNETAPGAGRLTVTLHSAVSGRPLQTILETRGVGSGTTDVAEEQRWTHFVIEAENVEWHMTLEQGYATNPR